MNIDRRPAAGPENSDTMSMRIEYSTGHVITKSFKCSFCKRGFSNAQALGGHMNIHRKDRAKLITIADSNLLLSLDITNNNNSADSVYSQTCRKAGSDGKLDGTRLPLFAEAPVAEGGGEVDLELRLGPDRYDGKTKSTA